MHLLAHFLTVIFIIMSSENSNNATPDPASGDVEMQPADIAINPQLAAVINRMVQEKVAIMEQSYREEFEVQWKAKESEADRQQTSLQAELLSLRAQVTQHAGAKYVSPLCILLFN